MSYYNQMPPDDDRPSFLDAVIFAVCGVAILIFLWRLLF